MGLDRLVKKKDEQHKCPFCDFVLIPNTDLRYAAQGQKGYKCANCYIPDVNTKSGESFSRYYIGVVENVQILDDSVLEQVVAVENFYTHYKDNQWYCVENNLIKDQTVIVMEEPAREEHVFYANEEPVGLVWVSELFLFPFIDTWDLSDEAGTLAKIRTYILFS